MKQAKHQVDEMQDLINTTEERLRDNVRAKRLAQRELRHERAASEELVRQYSEAWKELEYFKSNKTGMIERKIYASLEQ